MHAVARVVVVDRQMHARIGHIPQAPECIVGEMAVLTDHATLSRPLQHASPGRVVGVVGLLADGGVVDMNELADGVISIAERVVRVTHQDAVGVPLRRWVRLRVRSRPPHSTAH